MNIVYAKSNRYDPRQFVQIGPHLFAPLAEWSQASAQARHRALVAFYAGRLRNPNVVFSGVSGAVMRNIPVLGEVPLEPHCCVNTKQKSTQGMIKWRYVRKLPACDLIEGVRVACVERVLVDLTLAFDATACLVALNHCLSTGQTNAPRLRRYVEDHACLPGIWRMARLLPFANAKCESPLETLGWLAVYRAKLVLPCQQVKIRLPQDCKTRTARVDMCWSRRSKKLIVELDGKTKYQTREDLVNEKIREDGLRRLGCRVLRFLWEDVRSGNMEVQLREAGVKERRNTGKQIPVW
jgi:very-short-patch-repair endonuclease